MAATTPATYFEVQQSGTQEAPSAANDVYEDIVDMALLMTVFVIGWVLVSSINRRLGTDRRSAKPASFKKSSCFSPAGKLSGEGKAKAFSADFADMSPLEFEGAASFYRRPSLASSDTDASTSASADDAAAQKCDGWLDPALLFDECDVPQTVQAADDLVTVVGMPMDQVDAVDAKLGKLAAVNDLTSCWSLWRSLPYHVALSSGTCDALAFAVRRAAVATVDAEHALEAAAASGHAGLGESALVAGSRVQSAAWLARASSRLEAAGVVRGRGHATDLALAYGREQRADLAVDLWHNHCASRGLPLSDEGSETEQELPEPELYGAALEACAAASDFASAARLVRSAAWRAPPTASGQAALLALARWLARQQGVGQARRCLAAVRRAGGAVNLVTFRALLATCARGGDMVQADEMFRELGESGLSPDFSIFSTLVRGYCSAGNLEQALLHFRLMRTHGFQPDSALFDAVLSACVNKNLLTLAEEVLAEREAALGDRPTGATLAILVRLHGARGDLDRAVEVFEELPRQHGVEVDARGYHALISTCLASGRLDLALDAFSAMSNAGCNTNAKTYEALITASLRKGALDQAAALVKDSFGLQPAPAAAAALAADDGAAAAGSTAVPQQQQQPATAAEGSTLPSSDFAPDSSSDGHLPQRRALLEQRVVEAVLELAGRRREAMRIGLPLLQSLEEAGFSVSERLAASLRRAAAAEAARPTGPQHHQRAHRAAAWESWRHGFKRLGHEAHVED